MDESMEIRYSQTRGVSALYGQTRVESTPLTRSDMCESILGLRRITSETDTRKLYFLQVLINSAPRTVPKSIFIRRVFRNFDHGREQNG